MHSPLSLLRARLLVLIALTAVLTACVPTLLYRHADRLVLWKVDDYFNLSPEQRAVLRPRLQTILANHRREALPLYVQVLTEVKTRSADGLTADDIEWVFSRYEELRRDLFARFTDDAAMFLASVTDGQVTHVERVFRKEQEKSGKLLQMSAEARLSKRAVDTVSLLKEWLGPLSKQQQEKVGELSRRLPDFQPQRVAYKRHRQQGFVRLLQQTRNANVLAAQVETWLVYPEQEAPPAYREGMADMRQAVKDMALAIDAVITPEQRAHALRKLQSLIDDVRRLSES